MDASDDNIKRRGTIFPHFNHLCSYTNVVILFQENFQTRTHPDLLLLIVLLLRDNPNMLWQLAEPGRWLS